MNRSQIARICKLCRRIAARRGAQQTQILPGIAVRRVAFSVPVQNVADELALRSRVRLAVARQRCDKRILERRVFAREFLISAEEVTKPYRLPPRTALRKNEMKMMRAPPARMPHQPSPIA